MTIHCTRRTGFYGMGSPIEIRKNGETWFYLYQNQTKQVNINEEQCVIQARFFLLKSEPYLISTNKQDIHLEITMNPALLLVYVILFSGILLIPILRLSVVSVLFMGLLYIVFFFFMLHKAYQIKEISSWENEQKNF